MTMIAKVGTAAMVRALDRAAIDDYGIPGLVLMENAGRQAADFILDEFEPRCATVFCGKGNNGGDGFVIARYLINAGVHVHVFVLARKDDIKGDAKTNLDILEKMQAPIWEVLDQSALEDYLYVFHECDLIVDAILGTGLEREVEGLYRDTIEFINHLVDDNLATRVAAVDMPSGLNADTGQVMGAAVEADATVTFAMTKTGQLSFPGAALVGTLYLVDIGIPTELYDEVPYSVITDELAAALLPFRAEDAHKGTTGHGLTLAGSPGKTGAAVMAALAAMRAGAGLVTLAGPESVQSTLSTMTLEVMTEPLPATDLGTLGPTSLKRALEIAAGKDALALGPGLGHNADVVEFVKAVIRDSDSPLVIDADGLNAVAQDVSMLDAARAPVILTPHPGEMARLAGISADQVLADRLNVSLEFARARNVILALKGAHTLVAFPDGRAFYNLTGNPGMATAGSGDALTGVIMGLLCQGVAPEDAAVLGVFLHGAAGDLAAAEQGEAGMIARDIIDLIPRAILDLAGRERW